MSRLFHWVGDLLRRPKPFFGILSCVHVGDDTHLGDAAASNAEDLLASSPLGSGAGGDDEP